MSYSASTAPRLSPPQGAVPGTWYVGYRSDAALAQPALSLLAPSAADRRDAPQGVAVEPGALPLVGRWAMHPARPEADIDGTPGNDKLNGTADADVLQGFDGNDKLSGKGGADELRGGIGNDRLTGGKGNDLLHGGLGNDTYVFSRGDGSDTIQSYYDPTAGKLNVLQYNAGVNPADVAVTRSGDHLVLTITGTTSRVTVQDFFLYDDPGNANNETQAVHFADGTVWDVDQLVAMTMAATPGNDTLIGTVADNTISGLDGDDAIDGRAGNDTLNGGAGNDTLDGGDGDDALSGGAGNDTLTGGWGNGSDTLDGSTGSDTLSGLSGSDTYLIGLGDGSDTIQSYYDPSAGKLNVLQYDTDVNPADVAVSRAGDQLVLSIAGSSDSVTVQEFFLYDDPGNANNELQQVHFANGTVWDVQDLVTMTLAGTPGNDTLIGTVAGDTIGGQGGDDAINGRDGNDTLDGGAGNDALNGGYGSDTLSGGDGTDALTGGYGSDTLDGGTGDDSLSGHFDNDTYLVGRGDGNDTIQSYYDPSAGKLNVLQYDTDVNPADVAVSRSGDQLVLSIAGSSDSVTVQDFFLYDDPGNANNELQQVHFANGTVWDIQDLVAMTLAGTPGNDTLIGTVAGDTLSGQGGNDAIDGRDGNDTLNGGAKNDTLEGGAGNDTLRGDAGNDTLTGGIGNGSDTLDGGTGADSLSGQYGNDTYLVGLGDGNDTIQNWEDGAAGKLNVLQYDSGVNPADVAVTRSGVNLVLSINGSTDSVTVQSFYFGDDPNNDYNELQEVHFADGTVWDIADLVAMSGGEHAGSDANAGAGGGTSAQADAWSSGSPFGAASLETDTRPSHAAREARYADQTDALVSAMAAFAPPAAGQTALLADYHLAISPVAIAVN